MLMQTEHVMWTEAPTRELINQIAELQARVDHPQHWSAGEHTQNVEKLRQLYWEVRRQQSDASIDHSQSSKNEVA